MTPPWKVNTSNSGKREEYQRYLGLQTQFFTEDLAEPDADAETIVRFKASQFDGIIVDDVSLDVEGAHIGTHVRWKFSELARHLGKRAAFVCVLGLKRHGKVELYRGETLGLIVAPRGESFGFNPYFQPEGSSHTIAEENVDRLNPRFKACEDLKRGKAWKILEPLVKWSGRFQVEH